ncbi:hypothetical protein M6B38_198235 [Iris pallida]|uniref:Uncharacterized protein n=1 Tax=Iris pallida TaxID=29817 RepID=A0AAX6EBN4_IRIPA|nr:hypothetical protein M6B38_198235 [Iris pallida]
MSCEFYYVFIAVSLCGCSISDWKPTFFRLAVASLSIGTYGCTCRKKPRN